MESGFEIGIIGGTGGIGKWFAEYFRAEGFAVHVTGRTSGMSLPELARTCRAIFVSVPIGSTVDVIRRIGPLVKGDSLLADFTSLKAEPVRAMVEYSAAEVVGVHPLFGPNVAALSGENIILCPARGEKWAKWLTQIFEKGGARVTETTPEVHDRKMAAVQALPHLSTMAMGIVLNGLGEDVGEIERFSTPIFRERLRMIEKVFGHPNLYAEIIRHNPFSQQVLDLYRHALSELEFFLREKEGPDNLERELGILSEGLKKRI